MTRYKNIDLIKAFKTGATSGQNHTGNLYIIGDKLYNYSTIIAVRMYDHFFINVDKYSRTTSKIQSYCKNTLISYYETNEKDIKIFTFSLHK